mmetsp:Transcript_135481/g.249204  ORF Transcript_135481/g.249204 Transcript_135481/m.249204 type:complete len:219 (+) Transcript_135481:290-946(+)
MLDSCLGYVDCYVDRRVAIEPSCADHLNFVQKILVVRLVQAVSTFLRDDAYVDSVQERCLLLAFERASLEDFLVSALCKGLASRLTWTIGLLIIACVSLICAVSKYTVPPLTINEEVAHLIKYLTIWLQHVRLQQKDLGTLVFLCIRLQIICSLSQEVFGFSMDGATAEESVVTDFAEELVPTLFLHIFETLIRIKTICVDDCRDHWNPSLNALCHVP